MSVNIYCKPELIDDLKYYIHENKLSFGYHSDAVSATEYGICIRFQWEDIGRVSLPILEDIYQRYAEMKRVFPEIGIIGSMWFEPKYVESGDDRIVGIGFWGDPGSAECILQHRPLQECMICGKVVKDSGMTSSGCFAPYCICSPQCLLLRLVTTSSIGTPTGKNYVRILLQNMDSNTFSSDLDIIRSQKNKYKNEEIQELLDYIINNTVGGSPAIVCEKDDAKCCDGATIDICSKNFVLTGFDPVTEAKITGFISKNGGCIRSSTVLNTDYLIFQEKSGTSTKKYLRAEELNRKGKSIQFIPGTEFLKNCK